MRFRGWLVGVSVLLPTVLMATANEGCRRTVYVESDAGGGGEGGGFVKQDASVGGGGDLPFDAGKDALDEFFDPGCPDAGPQIQDFQCDPFEQGNGDCLSGEGCYIYVQYPDEPCGQEIYGAYCAPAGWGQQGDPCNGGQECDAGHVCVVTGSGTQCVQLCPLKGDDGCPAGFVCEPIDVEGFGGCL